MLVPKRLCLVVSSRSVRRQPEKLGRRWWKVWNKVLPGDRCKQSGVLVDQVCQLHEWVVPGIAAWYREELCSSVLQSYTVLPYYILLLVVAASDLPLPTIKFCSVVFGVLLRLLVINMLSSRANDKWCCFPAMSVTNLPWSGTAGGSSVDNTRWSQILFEDRNFCLPDPYSMLLLGGSLSEYCHNLWYRKTWIMWLPDGEKNLEIHLFVLTEYMNMMDGRTDGHRMTA